MRERNRRAREYSRRCWERRWNRRLWILNILLGLAIAGILLWALTLPEAQEPEDAPTPLSAAVQSAVLSAAKPPENLLVCDITGYCACCTPYSDINRNDGEGYYQTEELGDLYRQYKRDTARAMSILKARKPMRDVLKAAGRPV